MRRPTSFCLLLLLAVVLISCLQYSVALPYTVEEAASSDVEEYLESDGLVQENPGYVEPGDDDSSGDDSTGSNDSDTSVDDEYDSTDDEEEEEEEEDVEDAKSAVNRELSKSFKTGKAAGNFIKKHKAHITVALILLAFRREIFLVILTVITDPAPSGGRKMKPLNMTSILKILLVLDFLRKWQSGGDGKPSPLSIAALFGGQAPALVSHLVKDMLRPSNPSYIPPIEQHYTFERVNEYYTKDSLAFIKALDPPRRGGNKDNMSITTKIKEAAFMRKLDSSSGSGKVSVDEYNSTAIILDMSNLDQMLSRMAAMRDEISFLLSHHRAMMKMAEKLGTNTTNLTECVARSIQANQADLMPTIEVIILLGSPGGSASDYGLAAQQIGRLRDEPGIKVTICVDKVAASGGYMMACMSSPGQLYAAPFAVLGSIGVIGQQINIHNTLQNWGVKPFVFRGGKDKAPLGMIGEVTKEGMQKVQMMVDKTHDAFKQHVVDARPKLADTIDTVATGDVWLGADALEAGLVDRLITSDEYIGQRILEGARVLKLIKYDKRIHLPSFLSSGGPRHLRASLREMREFTKDARRIASKAANILDELPDETADVSAVAAACAFGIKNINAKMAKTM